MSKNNKGFTLIELMIVIAIIAIIAAFAIPNLLKMRQAANEQSGMVSLRSILESEESYKKSDYDKNGVNDYWTKDVAHLYGLQNASGQPIALIAAELGMSDRIVSATPPTATGYTSPGTAQPKAGYWVAALLKDASGTTYTSGVGGYTNISEFGFIAFPDVSGTSGAAVYEVDNSGAYIQSDGGAAVAANRMDATLVPSGGPLPGAWSTLSTLGTNNPNGNPWGKTD